MKRLWPDSVLSRTALILVGALVLALAATLIFFAAQRTESLAALGGRNAAERVASLARLLEETVPDQRRHTLRSMDTPGFRAGWGVAPLVQNSQERGMAETVADHLRQHFVDHEIRVTTEPGPGTHHGPSPTGMGPGHGSGPPDLGPLSHTGFLHALKISVRLNDDSWLNVIAPLGDGAPLWHGHGLTPLLAALVAVMAAALWAVRRATRPFATFAAAAERLGLDVAAPPVAETGPREVRRAALAFNVMQGRIRRFVEDRTQMLAAISHDLRTPLTRMKLRAEFIEDETERAKMLADLDEMEHMIAATLAFARDDAAREERRRVDMAALVQGLSDDFGVAYDGPESLVAEARPLALKRAIANLLDNAVKYGGTAQAALSQTQDQLEIVIDDDGPGIPPEQFQKVFAPFVRLESSRNRNTGGAGLGLAVARAAIRAHGGDIVLSNRDQGGLRVRVSIPLG